MLIQTEASESLHAAIATEADYYIGHNLGALAVCINAAKHNSALAGFDFEDYHREEYSLNDKLRTNRIIYLENKYVPQLDYLTFASPLMQERVLAGGNHGKKRLGHLSIL